VENFTRERRQSVGSRLHTSPATNHGNKLRRRLMSILTMTAPGFFVTELFGSVCVSAFVPMGGQAPWQENTKVVFISLFFYRFFFKATRRVLCQFLSLSHIKSEVFRYSYLHRVIGYTVGGSVQNL